MSPKAVQKPSLYEQLMALPEGLTGEIINGQLHTSGLPWARRASSRQATQNPASRVLETRHRGPLPVSYLRRLSPRRR
ncbi:MAG: hypothetical protein WCA32_23870 [Chromatiaceae bacterium]